MYRCSYYYNILNLYRIEQMKNQMMYDNMLRSNENRVSPKKNFTIEEAVWIAKSLSIRFDKFDVEQFRTGLNVELEHGKIDPSTNVTNDDPIMTGKIALAHLNEFSDYYIRLDKMEEEAEKYWGHELAADKSSLEEAVP